MDARRAAFSALAALAESPSHLDRLLEEHLAQVPAARDRAFAAKLVYGVLRHRMWLDHLIAAFVDRPLAKLDPAVLDVLRLGAAEAALLGAPPHALVHANVALAKKTPAKRAQGLVNAALRRLAAGWRAVPPPDPADPAGALAIGHSHPRWLVEELLARWGRETVEPWLAADQAEPALTLRANALRGSRDQLSALLAPQVAAVQAHPLAPEGLVVEGHHGPAMRLPGFSEGLWQAQDAAAQCVAHLLAPAPGMRVADLCAGAGGKTGHLAALMADRGRILAVDNSPGRLRALAGNLARLGVTCAQPLAADAAALNPSLGPFDRVLVDAPCTGLGVIGRRPDIRWRRGPADPPRLAALQSRLLEAAARLLAPGGALVYTTCTVTGAENEEVALAFGAGHPELSPAWPPKLPAPIDACLGPDGFFRTFPHLHRADAFFCARWVKDRG